MRHVLYRKGIADTLPLTVGQNKDDLLEMIQHGAEKIINNSQRCASMLVCIEDETHRTDDL